jgi:hypothetical protein
MPTYGTCTNFNVKLVGGKLQNDGTKWFVPPFKRVEQSRTDVRVNSGAHCQSTPEAGQAHLAELKCASYRELVAPHIPPRFQKARSSTQPSSSASQETTSSRTRISVTDTKPAAPPARNQPRNVQQSVDGGPASSTQRTSAHRVPSSHAGSASSALLVPPAQKATSDLSAAGTPNSMAGNAPSPASSSRNSPKIRPTATMDNIGYDLLGIPERRWIPQSLKPQGASIPGQSSASPGHHQSAYTSPPAGRGPVTPAPAATAASPAIIRSQSSPPSARQSPQSGVITSGHSQQSSPSGFSASRSPAPGQQSPQSWSIEAGRSAKPRSSLSRASSAGPPLQHLPPIPECQHIDKLPNQRLKMCKVRLDTRTNHSGFCSKHHADAAKLTPLMRDMLASAYAKPLRR